MKNVGSPEPHPLLLQLASLGIISLEALEPYEPRVRDRDDVGALRCSRSGVVVLDRVDHIDDAFYEIGEHNDFAGIGDPERVLHSQREDTTRRAELLRPLVVDRHWLDVGAGAGGIVRELDGVAQSVTAIEPQAGARHRLMEAGFRALPDLSAVPEASIEIATEFHVLEHVPDPLGHLRLIGRSLRSRGRLIVEVPHARDILLTLFECEEFRKFTLWSEHLVLHTRDSLRALVEAAGFEVHAIEGVQRYPLANHLHWLATGRPGGHQVWPMLLDASLDRAYGRQLAAVDATDTLILHAVKV